MDFQFDTTADGRTLKLLNVIDEFTREALDIQVDRRIDADGVVAVLDRLALTRGVYLRAVRQRARSSGPRRQRLVQFQQRRSTFHQTLAHPGRTPGLNRSTADSATSCSTPGASTRCWRPG